MPSSQGKIWYINNITNKIYRLDGYGFDMHSHKKHLLIRDIETGERWIIPQTDLFEERIVDGRPLKIWEEMPDGWHPISQEKSYPGYTNDPRKEIIQDGYDVYGRRVATGSTYAGHSNRERLGFKR